MARLHQILLILATLWASWFAMQAVHESGHVLGARWTGGQVARVVLHPLTISRTDLAVNPHPLLVAWAGPVVGVVLPVVMWTIVAVVYNPAAFIVRFFAGFCLLANGLYIGAGSFHGIGDCGEMLQHGAHLWQLWLFGTTTVPVGFWLWHGQGQHFGFGAAQGRVNRGIAYAALVVCLGLLFLGFTVGGN